MNNILFLAIRNLFETMDRQANSFPPILMLQVLHGCYPQFAERAEGGQGFQQQVYFSILVNPPWVSPQQQNENLNMRLEYACSTKYLLVSITNADTLLPEIDNLDQISFSKNFVLDIRNFFCKYFCCS